MTQLTHPQVVHDGVYQLFADNVLLLSAPLPHDILTLVPTGMLSRFASIRHQDGMLVLSSPLGDIVSIHDLRVLHILFGDAESTAAPAVLAALWSFLRCAGLTNTEDARYDAWTVADAVNAYGEIESPPSRVKMPPIQPPKSKVILSLPSGDPALPFYQLLRKRRTRYDYAEAPINFDQLGQFLFYTARVQEFVEGVHYDTTMRLYPSAGAAYELEIYAFANKCSGLASGLYHYDPASHSLEQLALAPIEVPSLIHQIIMNTGYQLREPQVILFISARIRRINWKNHALALANQDAGVLLQTCYLAATALDLAPCALGGLDVLTLQKLAGIDVVEEPLLAGFLLGNS